MLNYKYFCPNGMNLTQGRNSDYSHKGANAYDEASIDSGISSFFAPDNMKCIGVYLNPYDNMNYSFFEFVNDVKLRNKEYVKLQIMMIHGKFKPQVGKVYKSGEKIYQEGTEGTATGNHCHFELGSGFKLTSTNFMLKPNQYGVYVANFDKTYNIEDVFFVPKDLKVINKQGYNFMSTDGELKDVYYCKVRDNFTKNTTTIADYAIVRADDFEGEDIPVYGDSACTNILGYAKSNEIITTLLFGESDNTYVTKNGDEYVFWLHQTFYKNKKAYVKYKKMWVKK